MGETTKNLALIRVLCIFGSHYIFDKQWLPMAILLKPNLDYQILLLFIITYLLVLWILLFALVLLFNPNPTFLIYHWWIKLLTNKYFVQKQPCRGALKKRCFENMQQIYRITPMPKCDLCNFIEIALRHGCSPVNLLHIFRTPFPSNTSGWMLLYVNCSFINWHHCIPIMNWF